MNLNAVSYTHLDVYKRQAERLTAMNIENFLPVQEEIRQRTYRKKKIKRVVTPMMIFVHVDAAERSQVLTLSAISRYMVPVSYTHLDVYKRQSPYARADSYYTRNSRSYCNHHFQNSAPNRFTFHPTVFF